MLRVKKASINDEGTFTCVAENRVGKLEASATLTVRGMKHLYSPLYFHTTPLREVTDLWGYCSRTQYEVLIGSLLQRVSFTQMETRMLTPAAKRDVDALWIYLIIYISKCGATHFFHPPPQTRWLGSHVTLHAVTIQSAKPFHRLLVHAAGPTPGVCEVNKNILTIISPHFHHSFSH